MVTLGKETVLQYRQFINWTDTLHNLDEHTWVSPITEGKVTIAEIISHLKNWDNYLIYVIIPAIKNGEEMLFPEFDSFNSIAYKYARSGISKASLLDEFKQTRLQLVDILLNEPEVVTKHVPVNDIKYCPHTNTPYSLLYIIYEFIEHDLHHKNQILSAI